jgi:hypothetical protein
VNFIAAAAAALAMLQLLLLMASCMSPTPVLGGGPCLPYIAAAQAGSAERSTCCGLLQKAAEPVKLKVLGWLHAGVSNAMGLVLPITWVTFIESRQTTVSPAVNLGT